MRRFSKSGTANPTTAELLRVVVVEDSPTHMEMYARQISETPGFVVIAQLTNPLDVEPWMKSHAADLPHVVILDYYFPAYDITGVQLARTLRRSHPKLPLLLLTSVKDLNVVSEFMAAARGAGRGFLLKGSDDKDDFTQYIRSVSAQNLVVGRSVHELYERYRGFESLPNEDKAIVRFVAEGLTYDRIGKKLKEQAIVPFELAERTVQARIKRITDALGIPEFNADGDALDRKVGLVTAYKDLGIGGVVSAQAQPS